MSGKKREVWGLQSPCVVYGTTAKEPDFEVPDVYGRLTEPSGLTVPVVQKTVAVNESLLLTRFALRDWLKLNDTVAPIAMDLGPTIVELTKLTSPPGVLIQTAPQVTSKLSDGLIADVPTILITTIMLAVRGLLTIAVQL